MSDDKCGYDDSLIEDSAMGLDFKDDDCNLGNEIINSDDEKDPEDDPSWSFTPSSTAGDKFEADMDTSWVTMRMISHFISVTQPDLEEFLLHHMDAYFGESRAAGAGVGDGAESKDSYSSQQYEIYHSYCDIFEKSMEDFSDEHSKTEIVNTLKKSNQCAESGQETMGTILLDMLEALSDFREFHLMYVEKRQESLGVGAAVSAASAESKK